VLPVKEED